MPCPVSLSVVRHTSSTKHCALPHLSLCGEAHFQHQALCPAPSLSLSQQSGTLPAPSTVSCPVSLSLGGQAHFQHQALCPAQSVSLSVVRHTFSTDGQLLSESGMSFILMKTGWTVVWDDIVLQQLLSLYWKDNYEKLENKYNTKRMAGSCGYNSQRAVLSYMYMVSLWIGGVRSDCDHTGPTTGASITHTVCTYGQSVNRWSQIRLWSHWTHHRG